MNREHCVAAVPRHPVVRPAGLGAPCTAGTTGSVRGRTPCTRLSCCARTAGASVAAGRTAWSAVAAACSDRSALSTGPAAATRRGDSQAVTVEGGGRSVVSLGAGHRWSATACAAVASGADDDCEGNWVGAAGEGCAGGGHRAAGAAASSSAPASGARADG